MFLVNSCQKLIGLVRSLRSTLPLSNNSINAVAPASTKTGHLPATLMAAGLPVSTADFVGLAVVYSAVASQKERVEDYGRDGPYCSGTDAGGGRWNGRTILTLGDEYTELEEGLSRSKEEWFGKRNSELTRMQQAATDFREA